MNFKEYTNSIDNVNEDTSILEKVKTEDIVKELKKFHSIDDKQELLSRLNDMFGKYGTDAMDRAIISFNDTEIPKKGKN